MSNFLAIATVTAALRQTLQAAVSVDVPGASVTTHRPGAAGKGQAAPAVNVFLYQVTPNAACRNDDLPTRRSNGQPTQRPRAALDLHYLLSFYGDEGRLEPERLMGSVVRTLHERPVLARRMIERTLADQTFGFLAGSDLADEPESVRLVPTALGLEELSKLWSVFFQTSYALSVAYSGSVVVIDGTDTPEPPYPVRERNLYVTSLLRPVIDTVVPDEGVNHPIHADSRLRIRGTGLRGEVTMVRIGGEQVTPASVTDSEILVDLGSVPSDKLKSGVLPVQVVHSLAATTPTPHSLLDSNVAAIVLRPTLVSVLFSQPRKPKRKTPPALVKAEITPPVKKGQRAVLLLRPVAGAHTKAYTLFVPTQVQDEAKIEFPVATVNSGDYLAAVQIDGAESLLDVDTDPTSPTFDRYIGPMVTIP